MNDNAPFFDINDVKTPRTKSVVTVGNEYVPDSGGSLPARPDFKAYYGNQHVPHPTNSAAKITPHERVMSETMKAK